MGTRYYKSSRVGSGAYILVHTVHTNMIVIVSLICTCMLTALAHNIYDHTIIIVISYAIDVYNNY